MKSLLLAVVCLVPSLLFAAVPTTSVDIGQVAAAGSTTTTNGVYTVRGSGADIWYAQDEFRFVYGALSGDGEITARVDSFTAADPWAKAGVMIRESLAANSRHAFAMVTGGSGGGFAYRSTTGGATARGTLDPTVRAPYWLRLRRVGNVFTAYVSANGQAWRQQGSSITIAMGANVYAGFAVSSHVDGTLATAAFSNAAMSGAGPVSPTPSPAPQLTTSADIGAVGAAGSTSTTNGVYTVRASGADIWYAQDEFRYVYGALSGDGEITARVDSFVAGSSWAKAGVMIRESLAANSRHAFAMVTGGNGGASAYRLTTGGATARGALDSAVRAPYWVRLRRVGNVFTTYVSADGQAWRQQGSSVTIAMGTNVYAGLATTNLVDGSLGTATYSNVSVGAVGGTPVPTNTPPSISGTPATTATVGAQYAFTPTATDVDGNTLTYSIANRPSWATFNTSTGRLAGTPTSANVGTYSSIQISVSDGQASANLLPFSIVVNNVVTNRAPTISGTPATSVMQGTPYSFQPTATDADGDALTFSISNAPSWATFSPTTGRLQGTPSAGNVGVFSNIVIGVSDGKTTVSLPAFSVTVLAVASGSATLTWTPPTQNTDGSPLTNLAGYRIYWGTAPGTYTSSVTLTNPGLSSYVVTSLAPGTYYFVVTARNSAGVESVLSNTASKTIR
jgi:hypothetical protein